MIRYISNFLLGSENTEDPNHPKRSSLQSEEMQATLPVHKEGKNLIYIEIRFVFHNTEIYNSLQTTKI